MATTVLRCRFAASGLAWFVIVVLATSGAVVAGEENSCAFTYVPESLGADYAADAADTPQQRFHHARQLVTNGDFKRAQDVYEKLVSVQPDNVDYVFGYAQTLFWNGNGESALRCLNRARELVPGYEEVWKFQLQVLASRHGRGARSELEAFRTRASSRFPEAVWLSTPQPGPRAMFRWELGTDREYLSIDAPNWARSYAYFDRRTDNGKLLSLTAANYRRFDLSDNEIKGGVSLPLSEHWIVSGSLGLTDRSEFLAETAIELRAIRKLKRGWVIGLGGTSRRYRVAAVKGFGLSVERYIGRYRVGYAVDNARIGSGSTVTHKIDFYVYGSGGDRVGISAVAGEEAEMIRPGQLLITPIEAIAIVGRHPVNDNLSVLWRIGSHRQGSLYRRNGVGVSIAGGF